MGHEAVKQRTAVTIADVARDVGVATSTVSRALSQPGRVSESMRVRVVEAAGRLGYYPNQQARSLISGRTLNIGLLIPDITNPFFFDLIRGTQAQAKAKGYRHLLVDTEESIEVEAAVLAELPSSVDGIILAASRLPDAALAGFAATAPLVLINRDVPGVPGVVMDTPGGMVQAVEHLASLGHRDIAFLAGPQSSWSSRKRWRAIQHSATRLGIEATRIGPFSPNLAAGAAAADAAIHKRVTACIFFNDLQAIGALRRFKERGIRVPDDMSVVGCDDIFGADFCDPPLTTLTAPVEQAGRVATDILLSSLITAGTDVAPARQRESLSTHLTIRASTGPHA